MALVLFLSCFCWCVITQSLVAIQCNMLRCFEDDFHVFPRPWFGKSTDCQNSWGGLQLQYSSRRDQILRPRPRESCFLFFPWHTTLLPTPWFCPCLLSLSNIQIFSNIATTEAELFFLFSKHPFSDTPTSLDFASIISKTSILLYDPPCEKVKLYTIDNSYLYITYKWVHFWQLSLSKKSIRI